MAATSYRDFEELGLPLYQGKDILSDILAGACVQALCCCLARNPFVNAGGYFGAPRRPSFWNDNDDVLIVLSLKGLLFLPHSLLTAEQIC
jgi:hypothetical protein